MTGVLPWRRILLTFCAVGLILWAYDAVTLDSVAARSGISVVSTSPDFVDRIYVRPGSPADRAGLRSGDALDRKPLSSAQRYRLSGGTLLLGERYTVPIERNGRPQSFTFSPIHVPLEWQMWLAYAGTLWILAFSLVISSRRPDDPEARTLALVMLLFDIATLIAPNNFVSPWPQVDIVFACVGSIAGAIGTALLGSYANLFARPLSLTRRLFALLNVSIAGISAAFGIAGYIGAWTGTIDPNGPFLNSTLVSLVGNVVTYITPLICLALAIGAARSAERTRLSWAAAAMLVLYGTVAAGDILGLATPQMSQLENIIANMGVFITPIGLTYALLNRGLLDVGFALNRAAVFTATTLLFAGLFAALQALANAMLSNLTQTHNLFVQLAIAVAVYYFIRLTRARTDRAITSMFFAQRERQINAIRALMVAVDNVSSASEIAPFATAYLSSHTTIGAIVFLENDSGDFVPATASPAGANALRKDGLTVVTLRATRIPTSAADWDPPGSIAFPMLVRGQLRGVFLVLPQAGGDTVAPDETRVLAELANRMAAARDDLLSESLRADVHALREHNLALQTRLASLERS